MDATTENSIRQEQLESFGRVMAGFSHDMKNHLGIIRESNGLMDDIIAMGGCGEDETSVERLRKSISAIERRVVLQPICFIISAALPTDRTHRIPPFKSMTWLLKNTFFWSVFPD